MRESAPAPQRPAEGAGSAGASRFRRTLDRQENMGGELLAAIDALRGLAIVVLVSQKYIWHKVLRIAIDYREPGALHLYHDAVSLQENMIVGGKADLVVRHRIRNDWRGFLQAVAIAPAQDIARDHQLVSAHLRICCILFGIDVNQLHDPVAVRATG